MLSLVKKGYKSLIVRVKNCIKDFSDWWNEWIPIISFYFLFVVYFYIFVGIFWPLLCLFEVETFNGRIILATFLLALFIFCSLVIYGYVKYAVLQKEGFTAKFPNSPVGKKFREWGILDFFHLAMKPTVFTSICVVLFIYAINLIIPIHIGVFDSFSSHPDSQFSDERGILIFIYPPFIMGPASFVHVKLIDIKNIIFFKTEDDHSLKTEDTLYLANEPDSSFDKYVIHPLVLFRTYFTLILLTFLTLGVNLAVLAIAIFIEKKFIQYFIAPAKTKDEEIEDTSEESIVNIELLEEYQKAYQINSLDETKEIVKSEIENYLKKIIELQKINNLIEAYGSLYNITLEEATKYINECSEKGKTPDDIEKEISLEEDITKKLKIINPDISDEKRKNYIQELIKETGSHSGVDKAVEELVDSKIISIDNERENQKEGNEFRSDYSEDKSSLSNNQIQNSSNNHTINIFNINNHLHDYKDRREIDNLKKDDEKVHSEIENTDNAKLGNNKKGNVISINQRDPLLNEFIERIKKIKDNNKNNR